jgi:hypothetical protein
MCIYFATAKGQVMGPLWQVVGMTAVALIADDRELVPPVGVEPTLGTLLGGRPLPLGYGGGFIIASAYFANQKVTKNTLRQFQVQSMIVSG